MRLVIDAYVVISALIADSKTREFIVTLEPDLVTPEFVHDELENYTELIVEKSGMALDRVVEFIDLLFQYIEVAPANEFYPYIEQADAAVGDTVPDGVTVPGGGDVSVRNPDAESCAISIRDAYDGPGELDESPPERT